ncbi:MAG TPA: choice-of-anchor tandem repeat GloVer-containing protein [Terriglobales bacterium]
MFTHRHRTPQSSRALAALSSLAAIIVAVALTAIPAHAQTETDLYDFKYQTSPGGGCPPGSGNVLPYTGLLYHDGHLFGTTPEGGAGEKGAPGTKDGMVFKLTPAKSGEPPWVKKTVHSFINSQTNGSDPCSRLIEYKGVLYGTTIGGGQYGYGTFFSMSPPPTGGTTWTPQILYNFTGKADGGQPFGGLASDENGIFYGAGYSGVNGANGGVIFEINCTSGNCLETTLLSNDQGVIYNGDLLLDPGTGNLFGTTSNGGALCAPGYGNVFQVVYTGGKWVCNDLYHFTGDSDGAYPNGGLGGFTGDLFGTTSGGGNGSNGAGDGVLFELRELTPGNPYELFIQHTFAGSTGDGANSTAGLYQDGNGAFWGTTPVGGANGLGTVFELYPDRYKVHVWYYKEVYSFAGGFTDGAYPQSQLTGDLSGNLYGTTNEGGAANQGIVFEFTP